MLPETPEERKTRLATELAIAFHTGLVKFANENDGLPVGSVREFVETSKSYQESMISAANGVLSAVHPDLNGYTVGLDRLVGFVDALKRNGWLLLPSGEDGSSEMIKCYTNLQLRVTFLPTGNLFFRIQALADVESLNLKANTESVITFHDFDNLVIQQLALLPENKKDPAS